MQPCRSLRADPRRPGPRYEAGKRIILLVYENRQNNFEFGESLRTTFIIKLLHHIHDTVATNQEVVLKISKLDICPIIGLSQHLFFQAIAEALGSDIFDIPVPMAEAIVVAPAAAATVAADRPTEMLKAAVRNGSSKVYKKQTQVAASGV